MNTEQRLRFEAKHKVPDGVVWSEKLNCYTKTFPSSRNDSWVAIQNAIWQGYQSALEDRQGEAVATLRLKWQQNAGGEHYVYHLSLDCMEHSLTIDAFDALCEQLGPGEHKLFTSPQPAQSQQGEAVAWPNGCDETVPQALRYLAEHERPAGGNDNFNSEHLHQLADEIEELASKPLFTSPQPAQPDIVERIATWLESQRNDIPAQGSEFAAALRQSDFSSSTSAQPDQWNAAIEALAKDITHDILALRKGA